MVPDEVLKRIDSLETRMVALEGVIGNLSLRDRSPSSASSYLEPLAMSLARVAGARFHHERFFSLLDAGEVCIQYTGITALAICKTLGHLDIRKEFTQPISFGHWAGLIRDMVNREGFTDTIIGKALRSSLVRPNGKPTTAARYLLDEFINLRNHERGHTASLPDQAYDALVMRHASNFYDVFESLAYLRHPLARVESVDVVADPISYDIRLLTGPPPLTETQRVQSSSRLNLEAVCVWDGVEGLLDLGDLLVYRSCPTCNLEHTFFLERWTDDVKYYHAYLGNHRFRVGDAQGS